MQYLHLTLLLLCLGGSLSQWNFGAANVGGGNFGGGNFGGGNIGGGNLGGGHFGGNFNLNKFFGVGAGPGGFKTRGGGTQGGQIGGDIAAGGEDQFQREVLNPMDCPAEERSREGDELLVTYKGALADGKIFDSNQGKAPLRFQLGEKPRRLIVGWYKGLAGTCAGEKVQLVIPASLGYGDKGRGPVPGGATMYFTMTLKGIVRGGRPIGGDTTAGGVDQFQREVLNPLGCRTEERSREGDELLVTYKGTFADGTVFDEKKATDDFRFPLGGRDEEGKPLLETSGFHMGLVDTCAGEKVTLVIPASLGFGEEGKGPVPGGATVFFTVTVQEIVRKFRGPA